MSSCLIAISTSEWCSKVKVLTSLTFLAFFHWELSRKYAASYHRNMSSFLFYCTLPEGRRCDAILLAAVLRVMMALTNFYDLFFYRYSERKISERPKKDLFKNFCKIVRHFLLILCNKASINENFISEISIKCKIHMKSAFSSQNRFFNDAITFIDT